MLRAEAQALSVDGTGALRGENGSEHRHGELSTREKELPEFCAQRVEGRVREVLSRRRVNQARDKAHVRHAGLERLIYLVLQRHPPGS
jgi:hypothetical protein